MDPEILEILTSIISGPASAVGVCLLVMWYGYKLIVTNILPQQKEQMQQILEEHKKDREVFSEGLQIMDKRLDQVEDHVRIIKHKINNIDFRDSMRTELHLNMLENNKGDQHDKQQTIP